MWKAVFVNSSWYLGRTRKRSDPKRKLRRECLIAIPGEVRLVKPISHKHRKIVGDYLYKKIFGVPITPEGMGWTLSIS